MARPTVVKNQKGFSLLEVLVFVSIVSLFFVAAAAVATFSLRTLKSNENKILATRYAEEVVEWVRGEKEADWETFQTSRIGTFCMDQSPPIWPSTGGCGLNQYLVSNQNQLTIFKREMTLSSQQISPGRIRVNANITVSWTEGTKTLTVPIKTIFERFE